MQNQSVERPERGFAWAIAESRPPAVVTLVVGAVGLILAVVGTIVILIAKDVTPVPNLVAGFKSSALRVDLIVSLLLGVGAVGAGTVMYRRMPTKVSRDEAVAGAILGLQAVAIAALLLWFSSGDVEKFAINYLDFKVLGPVFGQFLNGAKNTLFLALSAEALGIVLGLFLAVFAISKRAVVRAPARIYINFFRGTPLVWQLIFIGVGLPIGLQLDIGTYQAAVIALTLNMGAYAAEVFRAGIQSIERGQMEAARGLGMSYLQAMRYAVIPQAVRRVIPPLMNEFVILIKDTSLVLVLGLTFDQRELMSTGEALVANTFNATFYIMTAAGYLAVSLPLIRIVNSVEKRLRSGLVGIAG